MVASATFARSRVMRAQGRYWLEYDSVVVAMLAFGITIVMVLALSI
jgi:hypothetical protein